MLTDFDYEILSDRIKKLEYLIDKLMGSTLTASNTTGSYIRCVFDSIPQQDRMKPMGISCPCPKCTPYSM